MRSVFGIAVMVIMLHVNLKKDTWDSVTKDKVGSLIFKTASSTTTNIIRYSAAKYLPLTIVSVISNLTPIVVVVLAYLILKEKIKSFDLVMMLLTLLGIFGVIFGGKDTTDEGSEEDADSALPMFVLYILLMTTPFLSAGGQIAMRKMSKFNDSVVSWYLQWSTLITSAIIMGIVGLPFSVFGEWDWIAWVLAALCGASLVFSETFRFKALKLQTATALQKLIPLSTLF